jgi:hypothetical protein
VDGIRPGQSWLFAAYHNCPEGEKMVNTPVTDGALATFNATTADWDFWTEDGEWVTWNVFGTFTHGRTRTDRVIAVAYNPVLHNWWPGGNRSARVFHRCDDIDAKQATPSSDPGPAGDVNLAGTGRDTERGGHGVDEILGGHGADELHGGRGADQLLGGPGDDSSHGGVGSDELFDDHGTDELDGGQGNDRFSAMDDDTDEIDCGGGEDVVVADPTDSTHGCEHVFTSVDEAPAQPPRN